MKQDYKVLEIFLAAPGLLVALGGVPVLFPTKFETLWFVGSIIAAIYLSKRWVSEPVWKLSPFLQGSLLAGTLFVLNAISNLVGAAPISWYVIAALVVIILGAIALVLANWLAKPPDEDALTRLVTKMKQREENNGERGSDHSPSRWEKFTGTLLAPAEMPGLLVLVPAFCVVLFGHMEISTLRALAIVVLFATAIFIGAIHYDKEQFFRQRQLLKRLLSEGYAKYISFVVIFIATARLWEQQQITMLLENPRLASFLQDFLPVIHPDFPQFSVLLQLLLYGYAIAWIVDTWRRRALGHFFSEMLEVKATLNGNLVNPADPKVQLSPWDLYTRLTPSRDTYRKNGSLDKETYNIDYAAHRSLWICFNLRWNSGELLSMSAFVLLFFFFPDRDELPVIDVSHEIETPQSLTENLATENAPILIAASGGGSRAALYTYAALRGLQDLKQTSPTTSPSKSALKRVVLLSGVSGGSLALAGFVKDKSTLTNDKHVGKPCWLERHGNSWCAFLEKMAHPYIDEVLTSAPRFPRQFRNGVRDGFGFLPLPPWPGFPHYLACAINEHLFGSKACNFSPGNHSDRTLADLDIGVMFNTTIAGMKCSNQLDANRSCAGGRLVFTNLQEMTELWPACAGAAPSGNFESSEIESHEIPFIWLYNSNIRLAAAAALSANFPPVFPNATVHIREPTNSREGNVEKCTNQESVSFHVTDGGVLDNRGVISILRALRSIQTAHPTATIKPTILVLDASALDTQYEQTRGLVALSAARRRLADELLATLEAKLNVNVRYLTMPDSLRTKEAFPTHLKVPAHSSVECGSKRRLSGHLLVHLIGSLFTETWPPELEDMNLDECLTINGMKPRDALKQAIGMSITLEKGNQ